MEKNIKELSAEELKVIAFEAYQAREIAKQSISQSNQTIQVVNTELVEREKEETPCENGACDIKLDD